MSDQQATIADEVEAWFVGPPTLRSDVHQLNALLDDFLALLQTLHYDMPIEISTSEPRVYALTPTGRSAFDVALSTGALDYCVLNIGSHFSSESAGMSIWSSNAFTRYTEDPAVAVTVSLRRTQQEDGDLVSPLIAFIQRWFVRLGCASGWVGNDSSSWTRWEIAVNKASLPARWSLVRKYGRGAFWGTALGADLCQRLDGQQRVLKEAPVFHAEPLANGVWLQLSEVFPPSPDEIERLLTYFAPILDWTREDWQGWIRHDWEKQTGQPLSDAGVIRAASVAPDDAFPVRLLDDLEVFGDVTVPKNGGDDVAYNLYLERLPSERERALIQAVVAEWSRGEQQRIYEEMPENSYGWFHHVTVPAFNDMAARWRIDTSCRGVQWHSIEA